MIMNKKMRAMVSLGFLVVIIAMLAIFKPDPPAESVASADSVLPTKYAEATDSISAELVDCLFATSRGFLEYSADVSPYRKALTADLATTYAWIVCENDYKLSR